MIITYAQPVIPPQTETGRSLAKGAIFVAISSYQERSVLKDAGFEFSSTILLAGERREGHWWTPEPAIAARLGAYCDERAGPEVRRLVASRKASRSLDAAGIEIPSPDGREYLPFQRAGIRYCRTRRNVLLADEMGLGKTIQAVGVINSLEGTDPVRHALVICPASIKRNWARELDRWLVPTLSVGIATAGHLPAYANIVILNYDVLVKHRAYLTSVEWDLLIVDEAHMIKSPSAKRSLVVYGQGRKGDPGAHPAIRAKRKLLLTGTPIVNRPAELFPLIHYLDPERWKSSWAFERRYCGWESKNGGKNLEELQDILRSTVMLRRLKSEVLTELPPKWRQIIELPATEETRAVIAEEMNAFKEAVRRKGIAIDAGASDEDWIRAVLDLPPGEWATFDGLSALRHATAVAKAPLVVEHVRELLEETPKVVVFAHHIDALDIIAKGLVEFGVSRIDGSVPPDKRQGIVDRFQNDDGYRVFIGGITAAGVGITLTAANTVVFAELDWTPGNLKQAEDRLHRIGAEGHESIMVQHIVLEGSMDVGMAEIVVEKLNTMDQLLNRTRVISAEESGEDVIGSKAFRSAAPERPPKVWTDGDYFRVKLRGGTRQAEAIIEACKVLTTDALFVTQADKEFGSTLSRWRGLPTPRQAAAAVKMLSKYSRVIPPALYERAVFGRV